MRSATPANPTAIPAIMIGVGLAARDPSHSRRTNHAGMVAIMRAVSPDGTHCSAHDTRPFPPTMRSAPTIAAARQFASVGRGAPRARCHA